MKRTSLVKLTILVVLTCAARSTLYGQQPVKSTENATVATLGDDASKSKGTTDPKYVIGPEDVLSVSVWKEPDLSKTVPVRPDGRITLPLVGEMTVSGRTSEEVGREIASKLKAYMSEPEVTVVVQEIKSQVFNILGEVAKPGAYALTKPVTVVDAVAMAGGFRDFAKKTKIYVLRTRPDGGQERIPFNYKEAIRGEKQEQNIILQAHDLIVVP